jgi:hypothetical protein
VSRNAGSTTRYFSAATAGRRRVAVEQAFHLRMSSMLSGAGQRAEGLRPERKSTLTFSLPATLCCMLSVRDEDLSAQPRV